MDGVVNGVLVDPKTWFFARIGRPEGSPANDYAEVLKRLIAQGMRVNPRPSERPRYDAFFGVTVMVGGNGDPRGRIWLPSNEATVDGQGNEWFTREVQVIADGGGGLVWRWQELGGGPYHAVQPPNTPGPTTPPPTTPPPSGGGEEPEVPAELILILRETLARAQAIEQDVIEVRAELKDALAALRDEVAQASRRSYSGEVKNRFLGTVNVTLTPKD